MTHDPMCPMSPPDPAYCCSVCDGYECECDFIAKVRADEPMRAGQRVEILRGSKSRDQCRRGR